MTPLRRRAVGPISGPCAVGDRGNVSVADRAALRTYWPTRLPASRCAGRGRRQAQSGKENWRDSTSMRFPNETAEYRDARNTLLEKELELRRTTEAVAVARRALAPGGKVPEDYVLQVGLTKARLAAFACRSCSPLASTHSLCTASCFRGRAMTNARAPPLARRLRSHCKMGLVHPVPRFLTSWMARRDT